MTKKILVFDMDGTLLNSMGMWRNVAKHIEKYRPIINDLEPIIAEENSMLNYTYNIIQDSFEEYKQDNILAVLDKYFIEFYSSGNLMKNNVKELLDQLHKSGYKMYLATATDHKYALEGMKGHGLDKYLEKIYTPDTINYRKKDIRYFQHIINDINVEPSEIIFFDDVLYALKLADEVGFTTVAVQDDHEFNIEQIKSFVDYYINDFNEILEILEEIQ